jgi:hypothetical protein
MTLQNSNRASGAALAFIAGSVVFALLAVIAKLAISVPAVDADAGDKRSIILAQMRASDRTNLYELGWADLPRGLVRLPIATAMKMTEQAWQHPAQARADLIDREEKASAPAPAARPKPSIFE